MIVALLAYLLQHWQTFQIISSALVFALAPLVVFVFPESPRWLVAMNRHEEAMKVFQFGSKLNKKPILSETKIVDKNLSVKNDFPDDEKNDEYELSVKSFFTQKILMKNIIIVCTNCLVATLCYYGITFNSVNLGGLDIYLSFALSGVMEIGGVVFIIFFLDHLGRRTILIGGQLLTGIMCISASFLQEDSENGALVCTLIGEIIVVKLFSLCPSSFLP